MGLVKKKIIMIVSLKTKKQNLIDGLFNWPLGVFMTILNILSKMGKKF